VVKRGAKRSLMAEVSRERHDPDPAIPTGRFEHQPSSAVGAAIVHENDLMWSAVECVQNLPEASQELGQYFLFVVDRDSY
jgi:hypothetical protein